MMDKYIEAEMELAQLLGYSQITTGHFSVGSLAGLPRGEYRNKEYLPRWCRESFNAFELAAEYCVDTNWMLPEDNSVNVYADGAVQGQVHSLDEHPDKLSAWRYAIVQAVIQLLKEKQNANNT